MEQQTTASELVTRQLTSFGTSMVKAAIPSPIDGLKPVLRRILVAMRPDVITGKVKSTRMLAGAGELHPHGEDSIYNAAARLAQTFEYNPILLKFESSCGTYVKPRPAAFKYTSESLSEFARDVFFKNIEYRALPKELTEFLEGYEPIYLIPSIPTALLYANSSIGYANSSYTVSHNLNDVCDLAVLYCHHMAKTPMQLFDYAKHAEKFLPDFPIINTLTNHRQLLSAYRRGEFSKKITMDGEVELSSDTIIIRTLPYGGKFEDLEQCIQNLMSQKGEWFDRNLQWVKDLSDGHADGEITVKLKRGVNVFEAWDMLRPRISFCGSLTPISNYNQDGYTVEIPQPHILHLWYQARYNILVSSKKLKITTLTDHLRRTEAVLMFCDHMDISVQILRQNDKTTAIELLQPALNITHFQATHLSNMPLSTLTTSSKPELLKRKEELDRELQIIRESFGKIPYEMAAEATSIKKKYPTPRRTRIPAYIGYVRIGGGCIQINTVDEIPGIIEAFPKVDLEIYIYDGPYLYKVTEGGKFESGSIAKITTGDIYGLKTDLELNPRSDKVITVNIVDGVACCVKGFVPGLRKEGYFYTTPISKAITRQGEVKTIEVAKEISLRKTICRGAATNIIYIYPQCLQAHYIFALNTSTPNVIAIQKVTPEHSKIAMNPTGTVYVVHSTETHFFLNIAPEFLNRSSVRVVEFIDVEKLLAGKAHARIDLATTAAKANKHIRLL